MRNKARIDELSNLKSENLLDTAITMAETLVDNYIKEPLEHEYIVFKKKLIAIPILLEELLSVSKNNKTSKKDIEQIISEIEEGIKEVKLDIYTAWRTGELLKDLAETPKKTIDKLYLNYISNLPNTAQEVIEYLGLDN